MPWPPAAASRLSSSTRSSARFKARWASFPSVSCATGGESFVELNAVDSTGKTSYGTAGYLGQGYFITVKHGVMALDEPDEGRGSRRIENIKIRYKGKDLPARVVDAGNADVEVHPGDWAIIKVRGTVESRHCASTRPTGMNSPSRSSASETTIRRASSSAPATLASAPPMDWSPASPTAIPASQAAGC